MSQKNELNLYIHIPFCPSKCPYCAFKTGVHRDSTIDLYVQKLCSEIQSRLTPLQKSSIRTIYMGGGTTNLLSIQQLSQIMKTIHDFTSFCEQPEITAELHPLLIQKEYIQEMLALGFNRFSIGVQSFQDEELQFLKRDYSSKEVQEKIFLLREAQIPNLNLDFIIALPSQEKEHLEANIQTALKFSPEHLSHYLLSMDEGSFWTHQKNKGQFEEIEEDRAAQLYNHVCQTLENSYHHYEISNWAKIGFECQHHLSFWDGKPYLGFGLSATSFDEKLHSRNTSDMKKYLENPILLEESLPFKSDQEKSITKIILGSRTKKGIRNQFLKPQIDALREAGFIDSTKDSIVLTRKGWLFNDYVVEQLVNALE